MFIVLKYVNNGVIRCDGPFDTEEAANKWADEEIKRTSNSRVLKFSKLVIMRLHRP